MRPLDTRFSRALLSLSAFAAIALGISVDVDHRVSGWRLTPMLALDTASGSPEATSSRRAYGQITITAGGTYSGNWVSTDSTSAVRIATKQPVTIANSTVTNLSGGELIRADFGANVTLTRVTGNGGSGRFFIAEGIGNLSIRNCTLNRTGGIYLLTAQEGASIVVARVKQTNVQRGSTLHQFLQLDKVNAATIDVSWNQVINSFGLSSVEDNISLHQTAFAKVHDNYIQGAYPLDARAAYSGSGIMVERGSHDTEIYSNQIVDTTNAGIGVSGGWNNDVHDNRLVSDGRASDGTVLAAANVGIFVWNLDSDPRWANNQAYGNMVGWLDASGTRRNWWLPNCGGSCTNLRLAGILNRKRELAEYRIWVAKLAGQGVVVGA